MASCSGSELTRLEKTSSVVGKGRCLRVLCLSVKRHKVDCDGAQPRRVHDCSSHPKTSAFFCQLLPHGTYHSHQPQANDVISQNDSADSEFRVCQIARHLHESQKSGRRNE